MKTLMYNGREIEELKLDKFGNLYYSDKLKKINICESNQSYSPRVNKKKVSIQKFKALISTYGDELKDEFLKEISKTNEVWKDWNDSFVISNIGRVANIKTLTIMNSVEDNEREYSRVKIGNKLVATHRMVAKLFIEKDDETYDIVNHKDGNKTNNNCENLEWCNNSMNIQHAYDNNLKSSTGEKVLTEDLVRLAREMFSDGCGIMQISNQLGFNRNTISAAINKKSWKHVV